ncbi:MAG: OmcA/MtrC family decaheme c-type cytochrome [Thaumarchaeota archaeon]|nr:OmcA/MtrC family decaheme c-type cytochrome [Nitrososphaerota archaeon]MCL5317748.1 OmcA/MtrC family decaheme c-type cytochrome [Nitrososphaerota archaeon]
MPAQTINITIGSVNIPADRKPTVAFNLTDGKGVPLRIEDVREVRFLLAAVKVDNATGLTSYQDYVVNTVNGSKYVYKGTTVQPVLSKAAQAGYDTGGKFNKTGAGQYTYKFGRAVSENYSKTSTHVLGIAASRDGPNGEERKFVVNVFKTFVPAGGEPKVIREITNRTACNRCHDQLRAHGGERIDPNLCVICHSPQTTDPETGRTVDFKVMIHKIHDGSNLPSVKAGKPYYIVGFRQTVVDFTDITWPQEVRNCDTCHTGPQGDHFKTAPNTAACTSCHDNVNMTTGVNHPAGPQKDSACKLCHIPEGAEFSAAITGAHTIPNKSTQLKGVNLTIVKVENTAAGNSPTVTFSVKDKTGNPIPPAQLALLSLVLAGPTTDVGKVFREDARNATDAGGGNYKYTFAAKIPANATGSYTVGIEGYRNQNITVSGGKQTTVRDAGFNRMVYFPVSDSKTIPRRVVVDLNKCNACHKELQVHGTIRRNVQYCPLCHNPNASDEVQRPANNMPPNTINFKVLIHLIHSGEEGQDKNSRIIYGFGKSLHNFTDVKFPGKLNDCKMCHLPNTYTLPLPNGVLPTTVTQGGQVFKVTQPITSTCITCHDSAADKGHAQLQTAPPAIETCNVCHAEGKDIAVSKVHNPDP